MKLLFNTCCILVVLNMSGQQADTTIANHHFNYIRRYTNGIVAEIGNYPPGDTVKNGLWYFYYGDGKPYLKGNYRKNERVGKWLYYDSHGNVHIEKMEGSLMNGSGLPDPIELPSLDGVIDFLGDVLNLWIALLPKH